MSYRPKGARVERDYRINGEPYTFTEYLTGYTDAELTAMDAAVEKIKEESAAKDAEIARLKAELTKPPHHGCVEQMKEFQRERDEARERIRELEEERRRIELEHQDEVALWIGKTKEARAAMKEEAAKLVDDKIATLDKLEEVELGELLGGLRKQQKYPLELLANEIRAIKEE